MVITGVKCRQPKVVMISTCFLCFHLFPLSSPVLPCPSVLPQFIELTYLSNMKIVLPPHESPHSWRAAFLFWWWFIWLTASNNCGVSVGGMICGDVENFQTSRFCSQHISSPSTPPTLTTLPLPTSLHHLQGKHREPAWQNYSFLCFDHLLKMPFWRGWGLDYWKRNIHRVPLLHQHFVKQSLCPKYTDAQFYSLSPVPCQNKLCCK